MRSFIDIVVLNESRRETDPHGNRFLLNPSRTEFHGFFGAGDGAAFICMGGAMAFGWSPNGSIDHSTIAQAFGLTGDEEFRGWLTMDGKTQIEVWIDAETEDAMTDTERAKVAATFSAAKANPCLSRIASGDINLLVFSLEHGQVINESRDEVSLTEGKVHEFKAGYSRDGGEVMAYENPSVEQALTAIQRCTANPYLRGICYMNKRLIVWDGYHATHGDAMLEFFPELKHWSSDVVQFWVDPKGAVVEKYGDYEIQESRYFQNVKRAMEIFASTPRGT